MNSTGSTGPGDIPALARPGYFNLQRLTAGDLAQAQTFNRELRWLHNRSLHGWGIATGYAIGGARGDRSVHVEAGYALDCLGHELILSQPLDLQVPAVPGAGDGSPATYYLTVSYADQTAVIETRDGTCGTAGAVRRAEMPVVRWQDPFDPDPASRYRYGVDVILGTIQVQNCRLAQDISGAERRDAITREQPYMAAGETAEGSTAWRFWPEGGRTLGVATTVSTASAGFSITPAYQAHVIGSRFFPVPLGDITYEFVVDGYAQIATPSPYGFDLRVYLPAGLTTLGPQYYSLNPPDQIFKPDFLFYMQTRLLWHVVWLGI